VAEIIDIELLRTFVTVVDTQSFTRSADRLLRTQSAISMQIKRLEQSVGKELFDRSTRRMKLTREGEILLTYARKMLSLSKEAIDEISQPEAHGLIRLGTSDDYANLLLPDVFRAFARKHPNVRIDVVCANADVTARRLEDDLIDLALIASRTESPADDVVRDEPLVWVTADDTSLVNGAAVPLAAFPEGCVCRDAMIDVLRRHGRDWRIAFSSDNIGAIHAAIRSGLAVSAVEGGLIPTGTHEVTGGGLPALGKIKIVLRRNRHSTSPLIDALAAEITARLGKDSGQVPAGSATGRLPHNKAIALAMTTASPRQVQMSGRSPKTRKPRIAAPIISE
jgi:DNA-binding transcriptional LysR family regulator